MKDRIRYIDTTSATPEECELLNILEKATKSEELKNIMKEIKNIVLQSTSIKMFSERIKKSESLLRTIRIKGKENACDLVGMLFVVDERNDIYKITNEITKILKTTEHYDLSSSLGSPPYKTVPLCYTILTKIYLNDVQAEVPFEIRIHDKVGLLATESNYHLYKMDSITNIEKRFKLSKTVLQILKLISEIECFYYIDINDLKEKKNQIIKIITENKELFEEYYDEIYKVFREYTKNLFKYNNKIKVGRFNFIEGTILDEEKLKKLNQKLNEIFEEYYERNNINNEEKTLNIYNKSIQAIEHIKTLKSNNI